MPIQEVREYFRGLGMESRVMEFQESSATVELAAQALQCEPARIAKTLSFQGNGEVGCILLVTAGDQKVDNAKFKARFGFKARMLTPDEVLEQIGHPVGGVCPFAVRKGAAVYLDESLRRFDTVYPACGSPNSAIELTCEELFQLSSALEWADVCKEKAAVAV